MSLIFRYAIFFVDFLAIRSIPHNVLNFGLNLIMNLFTFRIKEFPLISHLTSFALHATLLFHSRHLKIFIKGAYWPSLSLTWSYVQMIQPNKCQSYCKWCFHFSHPTDRSTCICIENRHLSQLASRKILKLMFFVSAAWSLEYRFLEAISIILLTEKFVYKHFKSWK